MISSVTYKHAIYTYVCIHTHTYGVETRRCNGIEIKLITAAVVVLCVCVCVLRKACLLCVTQKRTACAMEMRRRRQRRWERSEINRRSTAKWIRIKCFNDRWWRQIFKTPHIYALLLLSLSSVVVCYSFFAPISFIRVHRVYSKEFTVNNFVGPHTNLVIMAVLGSRFGKSHDHNTIYFINCNSLIFWWPFFWYIFSIGFLSKKKKKGCWNIFYHKPQNATSCFRNLRGTWPPLPRPLEPPLSRIYIDIVSWGVRFFSLFFNFIINYYKINIKKNKTNKTNTWMFILRNKVDKRWICRPIMEGDGKYTRNLHVKKRIINKECEQSHKGFN